MRTYGTKEWVWAKVPVFRFPVHCSCMPWPGGGGEEMGQKEPSHHLLLLAGDNRQSQGGHALPLQHRQQLQHDRGAPATVTEGEGVPAQPGLPGILQGRAACWAPPCWLEELASRASGPTVDPASCLHLQTAEKSRMVLPTPLYHCLGSVGGTMVSLMHGVTLILSSPVFDGKKALEAISRER